MDSDYDAISATLRAPDGGTIAAVTVNSDYNAGPVVLTQPGEYALMFHASGDFTNEYQFRLLDLDAATPIALGAILADQLSPRSETLLFKFAGAAGQRVNLDSVSVIAATGEATWRLVSPANEALVSGSLTADLGPVTLPLTGTYYLLIEGDKAGASPLQFQVLPSDVSDAPVAVSGLDLERSGTVAAGQTNSLTFTAPAGLPVYFDSRDRTTTLYVELVDPSGVNVFTIGTSSDDGPWMLPRSGTYTVRVRGTSPSEAGTYRFKLVDLTDASAVPALATNVTVSATLNAPYQTDVHRLVATAGQRLYYDAIDADGDNVRVRLIPAIARAQGVLDGNSDTDRGPFALSVAGTYYLIVESMLSGAPDYSFRLLDIASQPELPLDANANRALSPGRSAALFRHNGTAGQQLYLDSQTTGAGGSYWTLYGPGNQVVPNASASLSADIEVVLPTAGECVLVLDGASESAMIHQFRVVTFELLTAPLTLGTTVSNALSEAGEQDLYTFTAAEGQRLYYDALDGDSDTIYAHLYNPAGQEVPAMAGYNSDTDRGPFTLTQNGIYTLVIDGTGAIASDYSFRLLDLAASPAYTIGTTNSTALDPRLETDLVQFPGTAGQRLNLRGLGMTGGSAYWRLFGPADQMLIQGYLNADLGVITLPANGSYHLSVESYSAGAGPIGYSNVVDDLSDPPVTASGFGNVEGGTLLAGQTNLFTFTAPAGLWVYFDSQDPGALELTTDLRDPAGSLVFSTGASADYGPVLLPRSGTYTLNIRGYYSSSTAAYRFRLLDLLDDAPTLSLNTTTNGTLQPHQTEVFRFIGTAGQRLYYDARDADSDPVTALLFDPAGQTVHLNRNADYDLGPFALTASGPYFLAMRSAVPGVTDYAFNLLDVAAQPVVPLDTEVSGSLDPGYSATLYQVAPLPEGRALFFDALAANAGAYWSLYNRNNAQVGYASISGNFEVVLGAGGGQVLVLDSSSANPVPYLFRVVTHNDDPDVTANRGPVLAPVGEQVIGEGVPLTFTVTATDPDGADRRVFSLDPGAPTGATIDPVTGRFSWAPPFLYYSYFTNVTIRVTDDGSPALSDAETIRVRVIAGPVMITVVKGPTAAEVFWRTAIGERYQLQYTDSLDAPSWTSLSGEITATTFTTSLVDMTIGDQFQRYYRVIYFENP